MVQGITKLFDTYHETILEHMTTYFVVNHSDLLFDMCVDNLSHITVEFGNNDDIGNDGTIVNGTIVNDGIVNDEHATNALDQADDDIVINYLLMTIPRKTLALLGIYIYIFFGLTKLKIFKK